ncbi:MAG: glycosyltransferase family 4 protein [Acidobacteriales bacterium]|nr:glycosyltransferase family 4 protein [Terriglobales bacterium]
MRVALDIRRATGFGVGTYTRNIIRALSRLDQSNGYVLIGPPAKAQEFGPLPPNFELVPLVEPDTTFKGATECSAILRRFGCDLLHIPHLCWLPRRLSCAYVITVHDVLEHMDGGFRRSQPKRLMHDLLTGHVLRRAARVVAVSKFTKSEIEKRFSIPGDKIDVIYNAIDERFLRGHASADDRRFIAERYLVNGPFLLYAGSIGPHKNLVRIIEAFSALKSELNKEGKFPDLKLIIIGDELSKHPDLRRTVVRSGVQNDVRFLGFVPIDVLRIFYDLAKIFVFPSLYEGFGLQPLESMAHGTPVVTSNLSSLPEVVGKAAVLVNPENVFEIMRALQRVLLDQPLRDKLKERGYQQSMKFSWDDSARRLLEVYERAVDKGKTHSVGKAPSPPEGNGNLSADAGTGAGLQRTDARGS